MFYVCPGQTVKRYVAYVFSFEVVNLATGQESPEIVILATGSRTIPVAPMDKVNPNP